jgi:hypothetical protein
MLRQITDLFLNEADRLGIETRPRPEINEGWTLEAHNRFRQVVEAQRPAAASIS